MGEQEEEEYETKGGRRRTWDDDFVLKRQFSALVPAFDPRPGRTNVQQTTDLEIPPPGEAHTHAQQYTRTHTQQYTRTHTQQYTRTHTQQYAHKFMVSHAHTLKLQVKGEWAKQTVKLLFT